MQGESWRGEHQREQLVTLFEADYLSRYCAQFIVRATFRQHILSELLLLGGSTCVYEYAADAGQREYARSGP